MVLNWSKRIDLDRLVVSLRKLVESAGEVKGFPNILKYEDISAILKYSAIFPDDIPEVQRNRIVAASLTEIRRTRRLTKPNLEGEIIRRIREHRASPAQKYVLVTTISIKPFKQLTWKTIAGCRIMFGWNIPSQYNRTDIERRARSHISKDDPTGYTAVRVFVMARSEYEAAEEAIRAIDLLRGIWNLYYNRGRFRLVTPGDRRQPTNTVPLGPLHTLHFPNGKPATDVFWYETDYERKWPPKEIRNDWPRITKFERAIRGRISQCNYGREIREAIIRYTRALDFRDPTSAFVRLWSLLEYLTSTGTDSYDTTVRRASFIFRDHEFHRQVLHHLRRCRNRTIHTGQDLAEVSALVEQLRRYAQELLFFHLSHGTLFASLAASKEFLDLPPDPSEIRSRLTILKSALRFISVSPKT